MKKFLALAVFAAAVTTLQASTIASTGNMFYSARVCSSTCVSVTLSWANEPFPITSAEVDNSSGFFLFALPVFGASSTGSINPNPDTVGVSQGIVYEVSNGLAGVSVASIEPALNSFSILNLCNGPCSTDEVVNAGNVVDSRLFLASTTEATVPEPAAWTLAGAGLTFLFIRARARRSRA